MRTTLLAAALASVAQAQAPAPTPPVVMTNAEAHADAPADRARLLIAVETHAPTAAAAASDNAKRVRATLDTLRAIGLSREQLGTFGYSVQPQYVRPKPGQDEGQISAYVARNTVRVEIRKLDDVGRIIDAALAGGANSIGALDFSATNADSARRDALAKATAQAKGDADVLARAAGGTLGPLLELTASNSGGGIRPVYAGARTLAAMTVTTPIEEGPITISVTVNARWQFIPANR